MSITEKLATKIQQAKNYAEDIIDVVYASNAVKACPFTTNVIKIMEGVRVYEWSDFVTAATGIVGIPCACTNASGIFVNRHLAKNPELLEAVIYHELGHLKKDHLKKANNIGRALGAQSAIQLELEADAYAAEHGHKEALVKFLETTKSFLKERYGKESKEIDQRLEALN